MEWFDKLANDMEGRCPWFVRYVDADGEIRQVQVAGQDAQAAADYARNVEKAQEILLIARIDNNWK